MELVKVFASTWLSLDAYDKESLPVKGVTKKQVKITKTQIAEAISEFRKEMISKKEAGELFASERTKETMSGIAGNIWQSIGDKDVYPTVEEKAAHLLYFVVKNHPFVDGNKRCGAFVFIWFLDKTGISYQDKITPEALTALTLLVAESDPRDMKRMIGLVLMLLEGEKGVVI